MSASFEEVDVSETEADRHQIQEALVEAFQKLDNGLQGFFNL